MSRSVEMVAVRMIQTSIVNGEKASPGRVVHVDDTEAKRLETEGRGVREPEKVDARRK